MPLVAEGCPTAPKSAKSGSETEHLSFQTQPCRGRTSIIVIRGFRGSYATTVRALASHLRTPDVAQPSSVVACKAEDLTSRNLLVREVPFGSSGLQIATFRPSVVCKIPFERVPESRLEAKAHAASAEAPQSIRRCIASSFSKQSQHARVVIQSDGCRIV